jgi:hypothetical protein
MNIPVSCLFMPAKCDISQKFLLRNSLGYATSPSRNIRQHETLNVHQKIITVIINNIIIPIIL